MIICSAILGLFDYSVNFAPGVNAAVQSLPAHIGQVEILERQEPIYAALGIRQLAHPCNGHYIPNHVWMMTQLDTIFVVHVPVGNKISLCVQQCHPILGFATPNGFVFEGVQPSLICIKYFVDIDNSASVSVSVSVPCFPSPHGHTNSDIGLGPCGYYHAVVRLSHRYAFM